jgi:hypothetical protein
MPGIHMTIAKDGTSFKVHDACTADSTQCTSTWHDMFETFTEADASSFELTARYHETEELPELDEEIDLNGG